MSRYSHALQTAVLQFMRANPGSMPHEIADGIGARLVSVRGVLTQLRRDGLVVPTRTGKGAGPPILTSTDAPRSPLSAKTEEEQAMAAVLRAWRKARGWTLRDCEAIAGINIASLWRFERTGQIPAPSLISLVGVEDACAMIRNAFAGGQ